METLNLLITKAMNLNIIQGLRETPSSPSVSHLQFAEGTLLFINDDRNQACMVNDMLLLFSACSGMNF